ncbi:MAG: flagellar biosynthetic protein FliO [Planctomycetes bacterium]|nr:flagellar biosynthetic protein FliO [Planctomycetota bacterium]
MKWNPRWLLLPPVAALLIVLGPMAMQSGGTTPTTPAANTQPVRTTTEGPGTQQPVNRVPTPPRMPDLWQVVSTLLGLLVLGGVGILTVRRLRQGPRAGTAAILHLRQSLRLGARQAVHVVEFDDRLLLLGEGERGLQLLHSGRLPEPAADEAEVAARNVGATIDTDDEGATPRDLVIPRPVTPPAGRQPSPPTITRGARAAATRTGALSDFRALLQKAGKA